MKKFLLVLVPFAVMVFAADAYAKGPKVELSTEEWKIGEIFQWGGPATEVEIRNKGDEDLLVLDVKAACGCTVVALSEKLIKPGGRGTLKIDFDAYNVTGLFKRAVKVVTNDPASPEKTITITGLVKKDKAAVGYMKPDYIDMGVVAPYETRYFNIDIGNKGNADLRGAGVDLPAGYFLDSSFPATVPPISKINLRVGYRPLKPKGPIDDVLTARFNGAGQHEVKLKVVGYIGEQTVGVDSIVVTPTGFKVSGGHSPTIEVAVKNQGKDNTVMIEGVECSLDAAETNVYPPELKPGDTGKVSVTLKPAGLKPGAKGYLYLRVAVPIEVEGAGNK